MRAFTLPGLVFAFALVLAPQIGLAADWTIGAAGDYRYVQQALADTSNVTRGDTLTMLAGQTHRVVPGWQGPDRVSFRHRMTLRGENANVVMRPRANDYAILVAGRDVVFRDFTVRAIKDSVTGALSDLTATGIFDLTEAHAGLVTFRNVDFRNVKANSSGIGTCIVAEYQEYTENNLVRFVDCDFDSCGNNVATTNSRGPIAVQSAQRATFIRCSFTNCSAGRGPLYFLQVTAQPSSPIDLIIRDCLFANNSSSNTMSGGALHTLWNSTSAYTDTLKVSHCTFYNNTTTTAANGQFYTSGTVTATTDIRMDHCIFYGDGVDYAMRNPPGGPFASATYTAVYNCGGANVLYATVIADTLQRNPDFVTTSLDSLRRFMPTSCSSDGRNSICVTAEPSYMGYIQPFGTAAAPALLSPANGPITPEACGDAMCALVEWETLSAYADSFAIRWGTICGAGTYYAGLGEADTTAYLGPIAQGKTYYWQMRAKDCVGWGYWSSCRYFTWPSASDPRDHYIGPRWLWWRYRR